MDPQISALLIGVALGLGIGSVGFSYRALTLVATAKQTRQSRSSVTGDMTAYVAGLCRLLDQNHPEWDAVEIEKNDDGANVKVRVGADVRPMTPRANGTSLL